MRFIPAGAGNTPYIPSVMVERAVHPRWRGEHASHIAEGLIPRGSSPLARGTLLDRRGFRENSRFIPAGAGNTPTSSRETISNAVHPRWRGEHNNVSPGVCSILGSSPLARGTRPVCIRPRSCERFIPAGAGNTSNGKVVRIRIAVHPRWRGEHSSIAVCALASAGSSPLARGTRFHPM